MSQVMTDAARESMLEVMVNAALTGHDLAGFEPVNEAGSHSTGWQAVCRLCGGSVWVGKSGLVYSLLAEQCGQAG